MSVVCAGAVSPGLHRLYSPYADLGAGFDGEAAPCLATMIRHARSRARRSPVVAGRELRFVAPQEGERLDYERCVQQRGVVPTRPGNWHDFFNALVWFVFPRAKAVINARHCAALERAAGAARGPLRDALTLFDECGMLVVSSDADLLDGLRAHHWRETFHGARVRVLREMRFLVFGHAMLDALRRPFPGLCAKALYREVPAAWLRLDEEAALDESDAWLAAWLADESRALAPRCFAPLPVLGIPEVVPANAEAAFYLDREQFRRRRNPGLSGLRCV